MLSSQFLLRLKILINKQIGLIFYNITYVWFLIITQYLRHWWSGSKISSPGKQKIPVPILFYKSDFIYYHFSKLIITGNHILTL